MGAVTFGLLSHILSDENVQVSGIRIIGDTSGFTLAHQNFLTLDKSKKFFQLIHVSVAWHNVLFPLILYDHNNS